MLNTFQTFTPTLLLATLLTFNGCSDNDNNTKEKSQATQMQKKPLQIDFKAMFNDETLLCSEDNQTRTYQHKNTKVSIKDFRLFISNIYLIDKEGNTEMLQLSNNDFQYQDENGSVVLLDFEDKTGDCLTQTNTPETNKVALGEISDKNYSKIAFTLGVPFHTNHTENPHSKALNQPKMSWSWQGGRKFTKFESTNDINSSYIFNLHLGSTGCADSDANGVVDSCIQPNRVTITMDFDPSQDEIIIDYAKLLGTIDVTTNKGGTSGCMSKLDDPECATIIPNFGLDFDAKNGECENEGCEGQKLFYVDTKEQ